MVKLNEKRVKWLIDQVVKKKKLPGEVCVVYRVTERRVQQIVKEFKETKKYPELKKNRRPKTYLTEEQKHEIDKAYKKTLLTPRMLYYELKRRNQYAPKNKIYEYMKSKGWVKDEPNKRKKRKRCRYEWPNSGDMIHSDYHRTSDNHPHCIVWVDDASRKILSGGEFKEPTTKNAIKTFKKAEKRLDEYKCKIQRVNTDKGTQFFNSKRDKKGNRSLSGFEKYLEKRGINHIPSRLKNPQTNGKLERRWQEYDKHRWRFDTLEEWIDWYNDRLTTALDIESFETPNISFLRKLPNLFALFWKRLENEPECVRKTKKY
jgi:putative transposase